MDLICFALLYFQAHMMPAHSELVARAVSKHQMRAVQVEQGLGLGSGSPLFNRHVVSLTRFTKLRSPPPSSSSPPPVLVTHARSVLTTRSTTVSHS